MKKIILLILFFLCPVTQASDILVAFSYHNPWGMIMGVAEPTFALYDDGQMIFWDTEQESYQFITLDQGSVLKEMADLQKLASLKEHYELVNWTDEITQIIVIKIGQKLKQISIYGGLPNEKAPKSLATMYDHFINYPHNGSKKWVPEYLEIMLWPYKGKGKSKPLPREWPDINSETTLKRGDQYSIYLPWQYHEEFNKLKGRVDILDINGKKWTFSSKIVFPHETSNQIKNQ